MGAKRRRERSAVLGLRMTYSACSRSGLDSSTANFFCTQKLKQHPLQIFTFMTRHFSYQVKNP